MSIEAPEAPVAPQPEKVTGRRVLAALIDIVLLAAVFFGLAATIGDLEYSGGVLSVSLNGGPALLYFAIVLAYYVALEAARGQTLGKMVLKIRVVSEASGQTPSFGPALGRNLLRIVDGLPILYVVGLLSVAITRKDQRIGDMAANTLVVRA
ncbi:MAG: RDD family protein [Solirubrobacteraceae bacterium]